MLLGVVGRCPARSQHHDTHGHRPLPARRHDDRPPAPALPSSPPTRHVPTKFLRPCGLGTARGTCESATAAKRRCAFGRMGARAPLGPSFIRHFHVGGRIRPGRWQVPIGRSWPGSGAGQQAGVQLPRSRRRVHQSPWFHHRPPPPRTRGRHDSWRHILTLIRDEDLYVYLTQSGVSV